jgi:hypothetical protein
MRAVAAPIEIAYNTGPRNAAAAFPPACLRTHWDPTMVVKHVLPPSAGSMAALAYDPRPATRNCVLYYTGSAGDGPLPPALPSSVPPTPPQFLGGAHAPREGPQFPLQSGAAERGVAFAGFHAGAETDLLRINEPLTRCAERRYIPKGGVPEPSISGNGVPGAAPPTAPNVLGGPHAGCREADDVAAWARSDRLFFNPTKYDRTISVPAGLKKAESRGVASPPF